MRLAEKFNICHTVCLLCLLDGITRRRSSSSLSINNGRSILNGHIKPIADEGLLKASLKGLVHQHAAEHRLRAEPTERPEVVSSPSCPPVRWPYCAIGCVAYRAFTRAFTV